MYLRSSAGSYPQSKTPLSRLLPQQSPIILSKIRGLINKEKFSKTIQTITEILMILTHPHILIHSSIRFNLSIFTNKSCIFKSPQKLSQLQNYDFS